MLKFISNHHRLSDSWCCSHPFRPRHFTAEGRWRRWPWRRRRRLSRWRRRVSWRRAGGYRGGRVPRRAPSFSAPRAMPQQAMPAAGNFNRASSLDNVNRANTVNNVNRVDHVQST